MKKKITFGILCNGYVFEAWEASCINHLLNHPQIELKLLVVSMSDHVKKHSIIQKIGHYPYRNFLYRVYKRYWLKAKSYDQISFEEKFKNIPVLTCATIKKGKFNAYFKPEDITNIKAHQLDFMLRFGFNIIKGEILESCTYGIWSFHHADNDFIRGGPMGFWEIFFRRNTTAAVLQQLNNNLDQGKILRKGYLKTIDHSYAENIDQLTEMASIWPLQVCIDLLNAIEVFEAATVAATKAKLFKFPANWRLIYFMFILLGNKLKFHFKQLFMSESWQIARYENSLEDMNHSTTLKPTYTSPSNSEIYFADPFIWPNSNIKKLLFEYFSYQENCGKIAWSNFDGSEFKLLDFGVNSHLSYPFCFTFQNEVYCIPEQAEANCVSLYKIDEKGAVIKWKNLIENFAGRDTTLIFYDQKWWLFCTKANYFENAALFIFYSENLETPFVPHQNNPVKVDIQNARPAGSFFMKNNSLFRPAQNSAAHYGHKVNINKIITLNSLEFKEEIIDIVEPRLFGNYTGIHHISSQEGNTVVDLKQTKFSLHNFSNQMKRKLKRILKQN